MSYTNRDRLIEALETNNVREIAASLMCPLIPGQGICGEDYDEADFEKQCVPCIERWLDADAEIGDRG